MRRCGALLHMAAMLCASQLLCGAASITRTCWGRSSCCRAAPCRCWTQARPPHSGCSCGARGGQSPRAAAHRRRRVQRLPAAVAMGCVRQHRRATEGAWTTKHAWQHSCCWQHVHAGGNAAAAKARRVPQRTCRQGLAAGQQHAALFVCLEAARQRLAVSTHQLTLGVDTHTHGQTACAAHSRRQCRCAHAAVRREGASRRPVQRDRQPACCSGA